MQRGDERGEFRQIGDRYWLKANRAFWSSAGRSESDRWESGPISAEVYSRPGAGTDFSGWNEPIEVERPTSS